MGQTTVVDLSTDEAVAEVEDLAAKAVAAADAGVEEPTQVQETPETTTTPEATPETPAPEGLEIPEAVEAEVTAGLDMEALGREYAENGQLSDESRETVIEALKPQFGETSTNVLDAYLAGIDAQAAQAQALAHDAAGGADRLATMIEWAAENFSDEQTQAYNTAVNTPGFEAMAVRDLRAQYEAANGSQQSARVSAPAVASSAAGGVGPINSMKQLSELVYSQQYADDPGYRAQVDAAIAASLK